MLWLALQFKTSAKVLWIKFHFSCLKDQILYDVETGYTLEKPNFFVLPMPKYIKIDI